MQPGKKIDLLTKEIIALAVSATNGCTYCINSHTAAVQKLGLDNEGLGEVLAVVGLYNQMNKLADAYQIGSRTYGPRRADLPCATLAGGTAAAEAGRYSQPTPEPAVRSPQMTNSWRHVDVENARRPALVCIYNTHAFRGEADRRSGQ